VKIPRILVVYTTIIGPVAIVSILQEGLAKRKNTKMVA